MEAESDLVPGDTVQLKGGGPPMTVRLVAQELVYCVWYMGDGLRTGAFKRDLLARYPYIAPPAPL